MLLTTRGLLLSVVVVVVSSNAAENGHIELGCRRPWSNYTSYSCIFVPSSSHIRWHTALSNCRRIHGHVIKIRSQDQHNFVAGFIKKSYGSHWTGLVQNINGNKSVWDSLDLAENITNVGDLENLKCGAIDQSGNLSFRDCREYRKFICERPKFCSAGFFGPKCEKQCHCHRTICDPAKPTCTRGCEPGWAGPACSQLLKADARYYCFNTTAGGMSMLMRIYNRDITYRALHGLMNDRPLQSCSKSEYKALLAQVKDDWTDLSGCGGQKVGVHSMRWQFELLEVKGVESPHDLRFEVECDFSKAETMSRRTEVKHRKQPGHDTGRVVKLNETKPDVILSIDSAHFSKSLSQVRLGEPVKLSMEIKRTEGFRVIGVSPYNCIARGTLDNEIIHITNVDGCANTGSFVQFMRRDNAHMKVSTNRFAMFKFPSSDEVFFECQFDYCFANKAKCDNRCAAPKNRRDTRSLSQKVPIGGTSTLRVKVIDNDNGTSGVSSFTQDFILTTLSAVVVYFL